MNSIVAAAAAVGLVFGAAGIAHADGYLTPGEQAVGDAIANDLCEYIDVSGVTTASMSRVFDIIYPMREIADGGDVADVVNYSVSTYCPDHWSELVSFGDAMRNG